MSDVNDVTDVTETKEIVVFTHDTAVFDAMCRTHGVVVVKREGSHRDSSYDRYEIEATDAAFRDLRAHGFYEVSEAEHNKGYEDGEAAAIDGEDYTAGYFGGLGWDTDAYEEGYDAGWDSEDGDENENENEDEDETKTNEISPLRAYQIISKAYEDAKGIGNNALLKADTFDTYIWFEDAVRQCLIERIERAGLASTPWGASRKDVDTVREKAAAHWFKKNFKWGMPAKKAAMKDTEPAPSDLRKEIARAVANIEAGRDRVQFTPAESKEWSEISAAALPETDPALLAGYRDRITAFWLKHISSVFMGDPRPKTGKAVKA